MGPPGRGSHIHCPVRHPLSALQAGAGGRGLVSEPPPLLTNGRHRTLVATTQAKPRGALTSTGRRPVSTRDTICRGPSPPPPRQEADEGCWGSRQPGDSGGAGVFTSEQGLRVGKAQAAWGFTSDHRPGLNARGGSCSEARPQGCYRAPPGAVCTRGGPWRGAQHPEPARHNSPDPVRGCHRNCSSYQDPAGPG